MLSGVGGDGWEARRRRSADHRGHRLGNAPGAELGGQSFRHRGDAAEDPLPPSRCPHASCIAGNPWPSNRSRRSVGLGSGEGNLRVRPKPRGQTSGSGATPEWKSGAVPNPFVLPVLPAVVPSDAILAGQAALVGQPGDTVTVATSNVAYLIRLLGIATWIWHPIQSGS